MNGHYFYHLFSLIGGVLLSSRLLNKVLSMIISVAMVFSFFSGVIVIGPSKAEASGPLEYKFDFGTETSPVMEGYLQVHNNLLYSPERGYGLTSVTNSRNRDGGDDFTNDFLIPGATNPYTFLVDLPNGSYNVTVYSGDLLQTTSTTKTDITIEGVFKGTIQARRATSSAQYQATVNDGQMTIDIGNNGYVSGIVIQAIVPSAPANLQVSNISVNGAVASVSLQWDTVADAVYYDVFRNTVSESTYGKLAQVTAASFTDESAVPGNSYEYRVASVSAAGLSSEMSPAVTAMIEKPIQTSWKFDLGSGAVETGYTQVLPNGVYDSTNGYGLSNAVDTRDRGGADNLRGDFLISGTAYSFMVDVDNGDYYVKVISGDAIASNGTNISIEGVQGRVSVGKGTFGEFAKLVTVTDGQLTITASDNGRMNAIEIDLLSAPSGLAVQSMEFAPTPQISLNWDDMNGASGYKVYRKAENASDYSEVGTTDVSEYVDLTAAIGTIYDYQVTQLNVAGVESRRSEAAQAAFVDHRAKPVAPADLTVSRVEANAIVLQWTASGGADGYRITRSTTENGAYTEVAAVTGESITTYTDSSANTSVPQYYRVVAYNTNGTSDPSNTAVSRVYIPAQPLPDGATTYKFDFGPGALADDHIRVDISNEYSTELKYGYTDPSKVSSYDRGTADPLKSDFNRPMDTSFVIDLPNGDYAVSLVAGDQNEASQTAVKVESIQKVQLTDKTAGEYLEINFEIALIDGQLNFDFTGSAPAINSIIITKKPNREQGDLPTVYMAGDSTVQTYDEYWKPEAGWGQMIPRFFTDNVQFNNHAIGGRSSKTFITEGRLDEVLRAIKPGDYFMIQFGHNDATISVPERYASVPEYQQYLKTFIEGARQRGATPILVTPMGRRSFNAETGKFNVSFPEYVQGMKEVAQEMDVSLVDLSTLSIAYYDSIGPEASKSVFLHVEPGIYNAWPNGSADDTHFQEYGAIQIARMLSGGVKELGLPISAFVKDAELPPAVPAKPLNLQAGSISNAGAVLKWDAVETTEIYKIFRKLSTETVYSLAGTATIPTISIGGMQEGLTYDLYVTAVNGRGESEPSDIVTIQTKSATHRFDFGPAGSPVAEGYVGIYLDTLYTAEQGYGIKDNTGMITRDRGTSGTDVTRDWLGYFNVGWEFLVDLPNGAYAVKLYIGDLSGTGRTDVTVEGKSYGTISAGKNSVVEKSINQVQVKDGQMNLFFGGATGIVNGLEITPILQAPTELKIDDMQLEVEQPFVKLSWQPAQDAVQYRIYRQASVASKPELLGAVSTTSFTDITVDVGMQYDYTVTSLDNSGFETVASKKLNLSTIDLTKTPPAAPEQLVLGNVGKNDVSFSWNTVADARTYNIYRSKKASEAFELIGKTTTASYTDTTVLTTIPYFYKVAAVNAGGISPHSESLETPIATKLVRQMEYIDRSPVAIQTDAGIYIGWRMLGLDPEHIAFHVYRDGVKLNANPIVGSTNFVDASGTANSKYTIYTEVNGVELPGSSEFSIWQQNYLSVPLQKPDDDVTKDGQPYTYSAGDASTADLDGDGIYEIVMLWNPSNAKDNSQSGYTGIVYMDAYKLDGTRLWRINMGPNIRAGAHYTQFMVYDLDGDGKAEVAMKTADGTVDGTGAVIGKANVDYRNSTGYILLGNEYLTVFDGMTGKALATSEYDPPRGEVASWGDAYGNRVDRFLAAVAYLDGERPSLVMSRGYYTRTVLVAYNYRDGQLTKLWRFDTNDDGNENYIAQGNHNLTIGDVDRDGKDEINFGAMAIDDDGKLLYSTGLGHGDAQHFGDLDPARPGLEMFDVHEHTDSPYGFEFRDAETGEIIWGVHTGLDTGRGMSADIDPNHLGEEFWTATIVNSNHIQISGLHNTKGEVISTAIPSSTNFGIWWDGDLLRELLDYNRVDKWDHVAQTTNNLFTAAGSSSNNGTKANPMLQADLFGDWREEVMFRADDSSEMRIYSTTAPTEHRIRTLMHDPNYRLAIAWQNVGYNQPPHPSFYLGVGMTTPLAPSIYTTEQKVETLTVAAASGNTTIAAGNTLQMTATVAPENAANKSVVWSVHAEDGQATTLATITSNGLLQANAAGTVKVTATSVDGSNVTGSVVVTINEPTVFVGSIVVKAQNNATSVVEGNTLQMTATVAPENAATKSVVWSVHAEDGQATTLATITSNGLLHANAAGTVKITATSVDGSNVSGSVVVTITEPTVFVESIVVEAQNNATSVVEGNTLQMTATVAPENAATKSVVWSVHAEDGQATTLATITSNGLLHANAAGTVKITATSVDGSNVSGSYSIKIEEETSDDSTTTPPPSSPIKVDGGTIIVNPINDSTGTAKVEISMNDFEKALAGSTERAVEIAAKPADNSTGVSVQLPAQSFQQSKELQRATIDTGFAIISITPKALKDKLGEAAKNVELSVAKVDTSAFSSDVKAMIGDNPVYDFNLQIDGNKVEKFTGKSVTVQVPYSLKPGEKPNHIVVYYIGDNGALEVVKNAKYDPSTGMVTFSPKHFSKYTATHVEASFNDIAQLPWAKSSIEELAARAILNGTGQGAFEPNRQVTRAEFLQMLISALELEDTKAKSSFTDVRESDWYYQAISSAASLGIVNGMSDGRFGANEIITRQDMAVMTYRAALHIDAKLNESSASVQNFSDHHEIAAYAREAVNLMKSSGLIQGVGEGRFAPQDTATRAQAAVLIHTLFNLE
jgi:large repetitive protein